MAADEFIDFAERDGSIVPIGHWLIDETCAQLRRWQSHNAQIAPATAYVNLGARQLNDPLLADILTDAVNRYQLEAAQLGLEVVEASFIDPHLVAELQAYKARGHPLSVDDFGTGYSSLSRLVEVPADVAKIDKSFVAGIASDPRRRALIDAVIIVAERLDLDVIGEGVETAEQAHFLAEAGCHLQQGFYHGRPSAAEALTQAWTAA